MGLTSSLKSGGLVIHSHTEQYKEAVKELIALLYSTGRLPREFKFTSMQVNSNATIARHVDKNNSLSDTCSFGEFTGGMLILDEEPVDSYKNLTLIDGAKVHYVPPPPHTQETDGRSSYSNIIE